jgi:tRNA1Val (adenine37-N6)-methyltransferase
MAFRFKQFSVIDEASALKVGTDAVILGAWAGSKEAEYILDVGTGCGLLPLMLAQRFQKSKITAIDIHEGSAQDAEKNFKASPWSDRLILRHQSLQDFTGNRQASYDLIISNPPYFNNALLPHDDKKKIAKHSGELSYGELAEAAARLLKPEGKLALILPYENREWFRIIAKQCGLHCIRELIIYPVAGKNPNRYLSEWSFSGQVCACEELYIRDRNHNYTEEYKQLTEEFYLAQ